MKKQKSMTSRIILIFTILLAITIILLVTAISINTRNKMYDQMTLQGVQLGNQIRNNLDKEEAVYNTDTLTDLGDSPFVSSMLEELGRDDSLIYVGILDHNNKVIAHSKLNRVGNTYEGSFDNPIIQQNETNVSIFYDEESAQNALSLTLPIHNGSGDIIGVLALGYSVKSVESAILTSVLQSILIGAIIFIIAIIALRLMIGRLMAPVTQLKNIAEKASEGDFSQQVTITNNTEIGALATAFNTMITDLNNMMDSVVQSIDETNQSSEDLNRIASDSKDISNGMLAIIDEVTRSSEIQQDKTVQVSEHMKDMTYNVTLIMDELDQFKKVLEDMIDISRQSEEDMHYMDAQIEEIAETSRLSGERVETLIASTEDIIKIVDVITSIANQTNLIALNAAIEAAGAGEHGRGFSIVAEEIRKLANESLKAVDGISKIVVQNQTRSKETMEAIRETIQQSEKGRTIGQRVQDSFGKINTSISSVTKEFELLETSSSRLTSTSQQVGDSIESIHIISEELAGKSQEANAWTEKQNASVLVVLDNVQKLDELAASMNRIVEKYKK